CCCSRSRWRSAPAPIFACSTASACRARACAPPRASRPPDNSLCPRKRLRNFSAAPVTAAAAARYSRALRPGQEMKVLLVYPRYPVTYMGFQYSVPLAGAKASLPPLGLLTVAAMLPRAWERGLVDLNVATLADAELDWADVVFISAMTVQQDSVNEVIARCRAKGKRIVAGGPHFYHYHADIAGVDHFVLGEAEDV